MADGSINIRVDADTKRAQSELSRLEKSLEKTAAALEKTTTEKNAIAEQLEAARSKAQETRDAIAEIKAEISENARAMGVNGKNIDATEFAARQQAQKEMQYELAQQERLLASQEKSVSRLEAQETKISQKLSQQTAEYEKQKAAVADLRTRLMQTGGQAMEKIKAGAENVSQSFKSGLKWLLKWGIGIRSLFVLVRKIRNGIKEGFSAYTEKDPETKANIDSLKASLNGLKLAWGAAFAPIVNAVTPLLQKLIEWLTAAANAVSKFIALLGGKSSYKKVVANMNSVASSASGASSAVDEAKRSVMGFDELNKLDSNSSSGSGGGSGGGSSNLGDVVEEALDIADGSFLSNLALSVKDVLFDWSDLNAEQIAQKAISGLSTLLGAGVGFMIGGVPGAIVGALLGLTLSLVANAVIFDHDGVLSPEELASTIEIALNGLVGGLIGFALGGPGGALIGATIGTGITLLVKAVKPLMGETGSQILSDICDGLTYGIGGGAGAALGFAVGGPAGAAIGLIAGLGITFIVKKIKANIGDNSRGQYKDTASWFICGVLGLPTNAEWIEYGKKAIEWLFEGFDGLAEELHWLIGEPLENFFEVDVPKAVEWFKELGPKAVEWLWQGFDGFTEELHWIIADPIERFVEWLTGWWESLSLSPFHIPHPVFEWTYTEAEGLLKKAMEFVGLPPSIPHLSISWLARGGIVDGATLFGAGEAGREAIMPLEHNTGWIRELAEQILGFMESRYSGAMVGMPAMAMGGVVPPRAVSGTVAGFSEDDIARLVSGIQSALTGKDGQTVIENKVYLDGKQIADAVTKWQRRNDRSWGA